MNGNTREVVYQSRYEEERSSLVDVVDVGQRDSQKCDKFPKRMVKTSQDIIDEQCITSGDDVLVVRDED